MRRRAHIKFVSLDDVQITTFSNQRTFNLAKVYSAGQIIDLIALKAVGRNTPVEFWAEVEEETIQDPNDPWSTIKTGHHSLRIYAVNGNQRNYVYVGLMEEGHYWDATDPDETKKGREATFTVTIV